MIGGCNEQCCKCMCLLVNVCIYVCSICRPRKRIFLPFFTWCESHQMLEQEQDLEHIQGSILQIRRLWPSGPDYGQWPLRSHSSALSGTRSPKNQNSFSFQFVLLLLWQISCIFFSLSSLTPSLTLKPGSTGVLPENLQLPRAFTMCKCPEAQRKALWGARSEAEA